MKRPRRESVSMLASMEVEPKSFREDRGNLMYRAVGQFYDVPNDRLMVFRKGSFAKTIPERAERGRVPIFDWHLHSLGQTIGKVVSAEETDRGMVYTGMISAAHPEVQQKMREGLILENSVEITHIRSGATLARYDDIPVRLRASFDNGILYSPEGEVLAAVDKDGMVEAWEIQEVSWHGIGLLSASAQDRPAIISIGGAIEYQDLPVADVGINFDRTAAAARVLQAATSPDGTVNLAMLRRAYFAEGPLSNGMPSMLGLIADVVDGQLVAVPSALQAAVEEVESHCDRTTATNAYRIAGRYEQKAALGRPMLGAADFAAGVAEVVAMVNAPDPNREAIKERQRLAEADARIAELASAKIAEMQARIERFDREQQLKKLAQRLERAAAGI